MMNHIIQNINKYNFNSSDQLLLDTNIWLFIFGPQRPMNSRVNVYSKALDRILKEKSCIYINVLIISEFINTYARLNWQLVAPNSKDFKAFRKSADFKPIAKNIAADVKRVLKYCSRIENGFETLEILDMIKEYEGGNADFNDQVLAELCKNKKLIMVTDDGDFHAKGISILTANNRLLSY